MSELLELALQAHGGLERWREVQGLEARVSLTGGLYRLKGYPEGVLNVNMRIDARRPSAEALRHLIEDRPFGRVVLVGKSLAVDEFSPHPRAKEISTLYVGETSHESNPDRDVRQSG
jgi:hypothetical protein